MKGYPDCLQVGSVVECLGRIPKWLRTSVLGSRYCLPVVATPRSKGLLRSIFLASLALMGQSLTECRLPGQPEVVTLRGRCRFLASDNPRFSCRGSRAEPGRFWYVIRCWGLFVESDPPTTEGAIVDILHFAGPNLGVGEGPVDDVKERSGQCRWSVRSNAHTVPTRANAETYSV